MLKVLGQKLDDGRWFTASAERNKGPILALLERILPRTGLVLEIGSGTGQHVAHFARALPELNWQPSDADASFRESIQSWVRRENLGNVHAPVDLDVCRFPWPAAHADAVLCINMIHVAPWAATEALLTGAKDVLGDGGVLFLYGPIAASAAIPHRATRRSIPNCGRATPLGGCVISKPSSNLPLRPDSRLRRSSLCLPTTSAWCF